VHDKPAQVSDSKESELACPVACSGLTFKCQNLPPSPLLLAVYFDYSAPPTSTFCAYRANRRNDGRGEFDKKRRFRQFSRSVNSTFPIGNVVSDQSPK
jgi:hypothetical protein